MAVWKVKGRMRWTTASGLGAWARAQNAVRLSQATTLRPGDGRAVEASYDEVTPEGHYIFTMVFPSNRQKLANDTFDTLTAPSVTDAAWMHPVTEDDFSKVTVHQCNHDIVPPTPCTNVTRSWDDAPGGT